MINKYNSSFLQNYSLAMKCRMEKLYIHIDVYRLGENSYVCFHLSLGFLLSSSFLPPLFSPFLIGLFIFFYFLLAMNCKEVHTGEL